MVQAKNIVLLFTLLLASTFAFAQHTVIDSSWTPSWSAIGLGVDAGITRGDQLTPAVQPQGASASPVIKEIPVATYSKYAAGAHVTLSTSFILGYFLPQQQHKVKIGDYFSGSLGTGVIHSAPGSKTDWWTFYRFQIGAQASYDIAGRSRLGLRLVLLDFAHNQLMQNISGSSVSLSYRQNRMELAAGVNALHQRLFGWTQVAGNLNTQAHLYSLQAGFYLNHHQKLSIMQELVSNQSAYNPDPVTNLNTRQLYLTHLSYAILF